MKSLPLAALLLSTSLAAGGAWAQTAAPTTPATTPAMPSGPSFVTSQGMSEFRASKFVGLNIYGSENEKIGDINELLMDGNGQVKAVVIGVGGFLGIGEKNVAVPWSAVTWSNERMPGRTAATTTTPPSPGASPPAVTAAPTTGGVTPPPAPVTPARSPADQAAYNGYPDHGTVKLTKAELTAAPEFKYYAQTNSAMPGTPPRQ